MNSYNSIGKIKFRKGMNLIRGDEGRKLILCTKYMDYEHGKNISCQVHQICCVNKLACATSSRSKLGGL